MAVDAALCFVKGVLTGKVEKDKGRQVENVLAQKVDICFFFIYLLLELARRTYCPRSPSEHFLAQGGLETGLPQSYCSTLPAL